MGRPTNKNLKTWSGEGRAAYKRSRRAKMRAQRIATRAALEAANVPQIFGHHTHTLMLLAKYGVLRRADLMSVLAPAYVDQLKKNIGAGFFLQWKLENIGQQRGVAICIDPNFPLAREVKALARKLFNTYPIPPLVSDIRAYEKKIPKSAKGGMYDLDVLFGFPHRTAVLASLEYQGGNVTSSQLEHGVPNLNRFDVRAAIERLKERDFIKNPPGRIHFTKEPWAKELRALLRAFIKLHPSFVEGIKQKVVELEEVQEVSKQFGLFGKSAMQRTLYELATRGTITEARLREYAVLASQVQSLKDLKKLGIVAVADNPGLPRIRGASRFVSLNAAHPLYYELLALVYKLNGKRLPKKLPAALNHPLPSYGYEKLFTTHGRMSILVHLALSPSGELDLSTLKRLVRQHDRGGLYLKLQLFEKWDFIKSHRYARVRYYLLNEKHQAYRELKALLLKIAEMEPKYKLVADMAEDLHPAGRKVFERNRHRKGA